MRIGFVRLRGGGLAYTFMPADGRVLFQVSPSGGTFPGKTGDVCGNPGKQLCVLGDPRPVPGSGRDIPEGTVTCFKCRIQRRLMGSDPFRIPTDFMEIIRYDVLPQFRFVQAERALLPGE